MNHEHVLLSGIRDAVAASGNHTAHWGDLRRAAFPTSSWDGLKAWCAENALVCDLSYTQSSRSAQVQFRRLKPSASA